MRLTSAHLLLVIAALVVGCSPKAEPAAQPAPQPAPGAPLVTAAPVVAVAAPAPAPAQPLSKAEEKRILEAAKNQKADDGATVEEVLRYAERQRPKKFKVASFELLYSGDGKPSVGVCYWVGSKRAAGDQYCDIGYEIAADHKSFTPAVGAAPADLQPQMAVSKVQRGKAAFLESVDQFYEDDCVDPSTKAKSC